MVILVIKHCMQNILEKQNKENQWQIVYSKKSENFLDKLLDKDKRKILNKISLLIIDDKNLDIKFLINSENEYRLRVGNYRIIYSKHEHLLIVEIIKIGDRKDIYK